MISFRNATKFCCEDLSYIENYYDAINDETQTWCCHHRLETDKNLSRDQLIECNLYFNRPASELIFLTSKEHMHLHNSGDRNPMYSKDFRKYMSDDAIEIRRQKYVGEKNGRYHTKQMYKDGIYETVKYDDIQKRLNEGWVIKGRPWTNRSKS